MKSSTRQGYHEAIEAIVRHVLRAQSGPIRLPDLARSAGFSRFHLTRMFQSVIGESPSHFVRRIRMERAAYLLQNTDLSILDIGVESGYSSGETFLRAFRGAFKVNPSDYRAHPGESRLACSSDLHWSPKFGDRAGTAEPRRFEVELTVRAPRRAAVWRTIGNYSLLADSWQRLGEQLGSQAPAEGTFLTFYYDTIWTHPDSHSMRADIGWLIEPGEEVPDSMRRLTIPGGLYAQTARHVNRTERDDAWIYMNTNWSVKQRRKDLFTFDEYPAWPLPFEKVETRVCVGLDGF